MQTCTVCWIPAQFLSWLHSKPSTGTAQARGGWTEEQLKENGVEVVEVLWTLKTALCGSGVLEEDKTQDPPLGGINSGLY